MTGGNGVDILLKAYLMSGKGAGRGVFYLIWGRRLSLKTKVQGLKSKVQGLKSKG